MRILIAPDKFKGSLTAPEAAAAIAAGLRRAEPAVKVDLCPLADGGEGTVQALVAATGGSFHTATVTGPLPDMKVDACFGLLGPPAGERTAVIEMSAASGLWLLRPEQRKPLLTTTYGTGELIRAALDLGASRIILGIGGSATTDGGLGCAQACGARIFTRTTCAACFPLELSTPATGGDLLAFHSMTRPTVTPEILVACDVTNPLFGPEGAACVFGPQKGATPETVRALDEALRHLAERTNALGHAGHPGAGAAGGLGFALLAFFGATLGPGIDLVLDAVRFRERLRGVELCVTGEGRLDAQSLAGKTPVGVARLCRDAGVPCVALAGSLDLTPDQIRSAGFASAHAAADPSIPLDDRLCRAAEFLADAAARLPAKGGLP